MEKSYDALFIGTLSDFEKDVEDVYIEKTPSGGESYKKKYTVSHITFRIEEPFKGVHSSQSKISLVDIPGWVSKPLKEGESVLIAARFQELSGKRRLVWNFFLESCKGFSEEDFVRYLQANAWKNHFRSGPLLAFVLAVAAVCIFFSTQLLVSFKQSTRTG